MKNKKQVCHFLHWSAWQFSDSTSDVNKGWEHSKRTIPTGHNLELNQSGCSFWHHWLHYFVVVEEPTTSAYKGLCTLRWPEAKAFSVRMHISISWEFAITSYYRKLTVVLTLFLFSTSCRVCFHWCEWWCNVLPVFHQLMQLLSTDLFPCELCRVLTQTGLTLWAREFLFPSFIVLQPGTQRRTRLPGWAATLMSA